MATFKNGDTSDTTSDIEEDPEQARQLRSVDENHHMDSDGEQDHDSASGDHSSTGGENSSQSKSGGTDLDDDDHSEGNLDGKKSEAVNRLRACVVLVLVCAALGVSFTVFRLSRRADEASFEIQYEGNVDKIKASFQGIFQQVGALSGLAADATAHSADHFSNWPYQTLSNFHGRAGNARSLSGALYVSINHIVTKNELEQWEEYTLGSVNTWIDEGLAFQERLGIANYEPPETIHRLDVTQKLDPVHYFDKDGYPSTDIGPGPYLVRWETSPVLLTGRVNANIFQELEAGEIAKRAIDRQAAMLSEFVVAPPGPPSSSNPLTAFIAAIRSMSEGKQVKYLGDPLAYMVIPVYDTFDQETRKIVAVVKAALQWKLYFRNILPSNVNGITVVLHNACSGSFTYEIQGNKTFGVGYGDLHDRQFDRLERSASVDLNVLHDGTDSTIWDQSECPYSLSIYPSQKYYQDFVTSDPINVTFAVGMVFFYTIILFLFYDRLVESRQRLILAKATKSTAIVSSLFPKNVRDRLLQVDDKPAKGGGMFAMAPNQRLKSFLGNDGAEGDDNAAPIADLFPHCTVMFADIAGFTAWSSTREPVQVFLLLQAVYQAFDGLAKRRRVFKVETIGDSYVAVTGLPEPQANHAVIMTRFAGECLQRLQEITKELEVSLGPDTGDLGMRVGLHSGPVTAGVLRGDRARFQLFGDTVNTASRMESTGVKNRLQCSQSTADILIGNGKKHWLRKREDSIVAKGKGVLTTYWLNSSSRVSVGSVGSSNGAEDVPLDDGRISQEALLKKDRLVDWMVEILLDHVKKIISVRDVVSPTAKKACDDDLYYTTPDGLICLDEVQMTLNMHQFNAQQAAAVDNHAAIEVSPDIVGQIREYVSLIAESYKDNPFHNFSHACHVTMSVHKLLKRIVAPQISSEKYALARKEGGADELAKHLNEYSHGIMHDPMALFAITFSALIHDVDHRGVSNVQLGKEKPDMAAKYRQKSVAEQNSVDLAWDVLMMDQFKGLRKCLFQTKEELLRFRQLIVNVVLATDIFDKELNDLRKHRWTQAFSAVQPGNDVNNLRATIVIEHIIQASDVSHTMQHWHVYRKWNTSLFQEMYMAYKAGRMGADPSTFWYQGELGFFDNYVIPLANKLKECNVFGVSSDEYLNYAMMNRAEWEERGKEIVEELVLECQALEGK